jgi:RNA polymerase-binding transcription factor DksA
MPSPAQQIFHSSCRPALSETERAALARIQASLDRIERGTYGYCAACRATIDEERLRAVPETDRCGACAAAH